ncbi:MAG TPA: 4-(cytidine 5'-diphospho)-2-C-methyl-D-erythritol kinase, partial [Thermoleophilia bacterium]|nr:4-(cytidine 5'-diphospho)-2-C-methyl-D-erythritol kinase [Thermoleophilia bacterium]
MAAPLRVRTPGKVNLTLLVGPRRGDGYHELLTVFVPVGLYDELVFELEAVRPGEGEPSGQAKVTCPGVPPDDNLVSSALSALASASGWELHGLVTVRKHLPVAAGMGGGSSNAAA